jgi:hypothetical protein
MIFILMTSVEEKKAASPALALEFLYEGIFDK